MTPLGGACGNKDNLTQPHLRKEFKDVLINPAMDKKTAKKAIAVIAITVLFLNMVFVGTGRYSHLTFWIILIAAGTLSWGMIKLLK